MSSAHRPTFKAARASDIQGDFKRFTPAGTLSSRAVGIERGLLKTRQQITPDKIDFKRILLEKEKKKERNADKGQAAEEQTTTNSRPVIQPLQISSLQSTSASIEDSLKTSADDSKQPQYDDTDEIIEPNEEEEEVRKKDGILKEKPQCSREKQPESFNGSDEKSVEYKNIVSGNEDEDDSISEEDGKEEEDDEDEDAELLRELEKLRKEKEIRLMAEEAKKHEEESSSSAITGEPSNITNDSSYSTSLLKRKWNDDIVFKNQARDEPKLQKRFVNDTIRSDFHRKFMYRFMK